jgi:hypothetical protein
MEVRIKKKKSSRKLRKWHKWTGVFFAFFLFMFAFSGIFLNHRRAISFLDIPREILYSGYRYDNWNNGSVRNTVKLSSDSVLVYGNNGIWLTDIRHSFFKPFSAGLKNGADNRTVSRIVGTSGNEWFAVTTFGLYKLDNGRDTWQDLSDKICTRERFTDLAYHDGRLILMTRSHIFVSEAPFLHFERKELPVPEGYKEDVSLFRTMWTLHSGELFGTVGKTVVDITGIFVIILCVTGLILVCCPSLIKRKKRKGKEVSSSVRWMRGSLRWHNKAGAWLIALLLLSCITGMFLRPPLLIAIAGKETRPLPGSVLDNKNPWFDKLRALRYDVHNRDWILYSSGGFYRMRTLESVPEKIPESPPVSVMGVTVMESVNTAGGDREVSLGMNAWIVGSFSGIYYWDRQTGDSYDFYTGEKYTRKRGGKPSFSNAVCGYSGDFENKQVVFEYGKGAKASGGFAEMPEVFRQGRMSLWHLCLEIHVGRIYSPVLGFVSDWFIFLSGVLFLIILVTGYVVYRRHFRKKNH